MLITSLSYHFLRQDVFYDTLHTINIQDAIMPLVIDLINSLLATEKKQRDINNRWNSTYWQTYTKFCQ